jgi:amidohydrolase
MRRAFAKLADAVEAKVIAWRRDIHQNPELSNREFRTSRLVAAHLRSLGLEVRTGIANTGVVGVLKGGRPGPIVAFRADMDALPVTEPTELPFASKVKTTFEGREVGVMHACGHDGHTAILMGVAEVFSKMRDQIAGSIKFIFQPAEEGPPKGEEGGARLMVKQGVLADPVPEAIFALHLSSTIALGCAAWRAGPVRASSDDFKMVVKGRQAHGASPWLGVDPIVLAAQIVLALQTIESRQVNVTQGPSVISVGAIHGGVRENIIPDSVEMIGTVRSHNEDMRRDIKTRMTRTAQAIAQSAGGSVEVDFEDVCDVSVNSEKLTECVISSLQRSFGDSCVFMGPMQTTSEDFAAYQRAVPGFMFNLGARPTDVPPEKIGPAHSPLFRIDEGALKMGIEALANLALDYMTNK